MATRQRPAVPSESPLERNGAQVLDEPRVELWPLSRGAHIYQITHTTLGEWRLWRAVAEANGVIDPLDLEAAPLLSDLEGVPAPAPFPFPSVPEGGAPVEVNLSALTELGVGPEVLDASPEMRGTVYLQVEDVAFGEYEVSARHADDAEWGAPVALLESAFEGAVDTETREVVLYLSGATGGLLVIRLTLDAWLALWLARYWPLEIIADDARAVVALAVPLDAGDGASLE